jgi:hypothetical protein
VLGHDAEFQRSPAVGALSMQQPDIAREVTVDDKVLAEDSQWHWPLTKLRGQKDRVPESPQVLAARRCRADPSGKLVERPILGLMVSAESDWTEILLVFHGVASIGLSI